MSGDWSLDEIINANKQKSHETKTGTRLRNSRIDFHPYKKGNVNGKWEHDLFEENEVPLRNRMTFQSNNKRPDSSSSILNVSGMPKDLVNSDFQEMAISFNCVDIRPHYDQHGNFLGQADLTYNNRQKAADAFDQFKNSKIDGIPLKLKLSEGYGGSSISNHLFVDKESVHSRLSFPRAQNTRQFIKADERGPAKKSYGDGHFLDRLADDKEFIMEEKKKHELHNLDHDMDVYMKRAHSRGEMC